MKTLLRTDFHEFETGMFSAPVGPHTEYHFLPEAAPRRGWAVACFGTGRESGTAWHVVEQDGHKAMRQTITNAKEHTHPMLTAGDPLWGDYTLTVRFRPESKTGRCGAIAPRGRDSGSGPDLEAELGRGARPAGIDAGYLPRSGRSIGDRNKRL